MAFVAQARMVSRDADRIRYKYRADDESGIIVVPLANPRDWFVEDGGGHPYAAGRIVTRAHLRSQQEGDWPEIASIYS